MLTLSLGGGGGGDGRAPARVLALGAHADDIEIGCGGTVLRLLQDYPELEWRWVVWSGAGERADEARASAASFLAGAARQTVEVHRFRDGFFPHQGAEIKEAFDALKRGYQPDLILTHYRADLHQDHRLISELTWNTFRDHLILEYEIPKYDGDLGTPGLFVHLDESMLARKVETLLTCFPSQIGRRWFTRELFYALPRIRGMESNAPSGYAEAFYCRKAVL
jgi:LmbE family N-acetylglucosaminyl deacetylase